MIFKDWLNKISQTGREWEIARGKEGPEEALQMAWDAALEAAANVCDSVETKHWDAYKCGRGPERADPHYQGMSDGAAECANAIRALKD